MTSHRLHALGCPVPASGLAPLATAGLLSFLMPALTSDGRLRARIEHRLARAGWDPARVDVEVLHGYVRVRVRRSR